MILIPNCEILITFTPEHNYTQNLSGHLFECFDYYFHIRKFRKCKILIQEDTTHEKLQYIVNRHYIESIPSEDIIIQEHVDLVKVPVVLNVDDCHYLLNRDRYKFACDKFYSFACGDTKLNYSLDCDIIQLVDTKIYDANSLKCKHIDYVKKIYPKLNHSKPQNKPFAHITKNCKSLSSEMLGALLLEYPNIIIYSDYLNSVDNPMGLNSIYEEATITNVPILDFNFSKYIYTPVSRHFDCSPRLIVECQLLGIEIVLWNINYFDPGLERRLNNYEDFILKDNDPILRILQN